MLKSTQFKYLDVLNDEINGARLQRNDCMQKKAVPAEAETTKRRLIPVRRYSAYRSDLSQGTVNGLVLKRKENGLEPHVLRINNRLYLIEDEWDEFLFKHREGHRRG